MTVLKLRGAITVLGGLASAPAGAQDIGVERLAPPDVLDVRLGEPVAAQPGPFREYACGTNGGPPGDLVTGLPGGAEARANLASSKSEDPFARYTAWTATGDTAPLEALHADAIADKSQHMDMYTEGHWWSDRVDQPNEILQRERLGGIALRRNQSWPGNTVCNQSTYQHYLWRAATHPAPACHYPRGETCE